MLAVAGSACSACFDVAEVRLPEGAEGKTGVLAYGGPGATATYQVIDLEHGALARLPLGGGGRLFFLTYPVAPQTLGFEGEPLYRSPGPEDSAPLPRGFEAYELLPADGAPPGEAGRITPDGAWWARTQGEVEDALAHLRFPAGFCPGCTYFTAGERYCTVTCPRDQDPEEPMAPEMPVLPELTPCPAGWTETATSSAPGLVACLAPEELRCPEGQFQPPGGAQCSQLDECPAGQWPEELPPGRPVLYVSAGAAPGGDGTAALPFATIEEATSVAPADGVIALGSGDYSGAVRLPPGVMLTGLCAERTRIVTTSLTPATVTLDEPGCALRHLTVDSATDGVVVRAPDAVLGSVLIRALRRGLVIEGGGAVVGQELAVVDPGGAAIEVLGALQLSRAEVTGAGGTGIAVLRGAGVELHDVAIRGTRATTAALRSGAGLRVDTATVSASAILVDGSDTTGVVCGAGSVVTLVDSAVRGTRARGPLDSGLGDGDGVVVEPGALFSGDRIAVLRSAGRGILVRERAEATLRDVLVLSVGKSWGVGAFPTVSDAGAPRLLVERLLVEDATARAIIARDSQTRLEDVTVRGTKRGGVDRTGDGLRIEGSDVQAARIHLADSAEWGLTAERRESRMSSSVAVVDLTIEGVSTERAVDGGAGVRIIESIQLQLARASVRGTAGPGFLFERTTEAASVTNVDVRDTGGRGAVVVEVEPTTVDLASISIAPREGAGLIVGSGLVTLGRARIQGRGAEVPGADGLRLIDPTTERVYTLNAEYFAISGFDGAGVSASGGVLRMSYGTVFENGAGLSVSRGVDVSSVYGSVMFRGNGVDLEVAAP